MNFCSTKTNASDASLNVTFSSCCSFSSVILNLLHYEVLQITLWCILGTLRITMGGATPSAEKPPREGKISAKVLHIPVRESIYVDETFPTTRVQSSSGKKTDPSSMRCEVVGSSSQWQGQTSWMPPHCWPNFNCSSLSSSPGTTALIRLALFWQMNPEGVNVALGSESRTESGA